MVAGIADDGGFGHKPFATLSRAREVKGVAPRKAYKNPEADALDKQLDLERKRNYFWQYAEILVPRGYQVTMDDRISPDNPVGRMRAVCRCGRQFSDRFKHAVQHSEKCPQALSMDSYTEGRLLPQSADAYRDKLNRLVPKRDGVTSLADINSKLDALAEIVIDLAKGRQQQ